MQGHLVFYRLLTGHMRRMRMISKGLQVVEGMDGCHRRHCQNQSHLFSRTLSSFGDACGCLLACFRQGHVVSPPLHVQGE